MKKIILFFGCLLFSFSQNAQVIPPDRIVNWSEAGAVQPDFYTTIDLNNLGISDPEITDHSDIIIDAIDNIEEPSVFLFPAGTFYFSSGLNLPDNVILRGQGASETKLIFDLEGATKNLINIEGTTSSISHLLNTTALKGSETLQLSSLGEISVGDYIKVCQDDNGLLSSEWAENSLAQINQVVSISGNTVHLRDELRIDFTTENTAKVFRMHPITGCGVECLSIERKDQTNGHQSTINFKNTANCWVKGVASAYCNFAHINIQHSSDISVSSSYFTEAFSFDGGGNAYGVMVQKSSGNCLITNNVFEHLRHSMILQAGANGNVFSYNFSTDPYWNEAFLPDDSAGDIVLHGNYPFANLFEGNICHNIVIDDSHGLNGPSNTFFRNRTIGYGIYMSNSPASPNQNFIGNEIITQQVDGLYALSGEDHFESGNQINGINYPAGSDTPERASLYSESAPAFWYHHINYPPIGYPNSNNTVSIPAKDRWQDYSLPATCHELGNLHLDQWGEIALQMYPNPAKDLLQLDFMVLGEKQLKLYNSYGQLIDQFETKENSIQLTISDYPLGQYYIQILHKGTINTKSFIKL